MHLDEEADPVLSMNVTSVRSQMMSPVDPVSGDIAAMSLSYDARSISPEKRADRVCSSTMTSA